MFGGANIGGADFSGSRFGSHTNKKVDLSSDSGAWLGADTSNFTRVDMSGIKFLGGKPGCLLPLPKLLEGANLRNVHMEYCDFRNANLRNANLCDAVLACSDLSGADLTGADLQGALLQGCNLGGAILDGCDMRCADLLGGSNSQEKIQFDWQGKQQKLAPRYSNEHTIRKQSHTEHNCRTSDEQNRPPYLDVVCEFNQNYNGEPLPLDQMGSGQLFIFGGIGVIAIGLAKHLENS